MRSKKPILTDRFWQTAVWVASIAWYVWILLWAIRWFLPAAASGNPTLLYVALASFFIGIYVSVAFHEIGHVIGGWAGGMQLMRLTIGGVSVTRTQKGLRMSLVGIRGLGGQALMVPQGDRLKPASFSRWISGGPAASAVLAIELGVMAALVLRDDHSVRFWAATCFSVFNCLLATWNLIPFRTSLGYETDGLWLKRLRGPDAEVNDAVANLVLTRCYLLDIRPRDWDRRFIDLLIEHEDSPLMSLSGLIMRHNYFLDSGLEEEFESNFQRLEAVADSFSSSENIVFQTAAINIASTLSRLKGDSEGAEKWVGRIKHCYPPLKHFELMVRAACANNRNDPISAIDLIDRFISSHRRFARNLGLSEVLAFDVAEQIRIRAESLIAERPPQAPAEA